MVKLMLGFVVFYFKKQRMKHLLKSGIKIHKKVFAYKSFLHEIMYPV
jgi:hypothetical protein